MESENPGNWSSELPGQELAQQISAAIVGCIGSWLSKDSEAAIAEKYGPLVRRWVRHIYDAELGCPVDWKTATMDSALDTMHVFLDERFPWLAGPARTKLNYCFIMAWK
jgi:hypothetical protein